MFSYENARKMVDQHHQNGQHLLMQISPAAYQALKAVIIPHAETIKNSLCHIYDQDKDSFHLHIQPHKTVVELCEQQRQDCILGLVPYGVGLDIVPITATGVANADNRFTLSYDDILTAEFITPELADILTQ